MAGGEAATQAVGASTRDRLVAAALAEFAAHGFDGASTRAIAERAGVHQPLINYHFTSKAALWRASVAALFAELGDAIAAASIPGPERDDADEAALVALVDVFVRFAAQRPELNRIMVAEATADSDRLAWITEHYTSRGFALFTSLWERLRSAGSVVDLDPMVAYYTVVGAASLLYANAPEARRITGREPTEPQIVAHHAEVLCAMLRNHHPRRSGDVPGTT